MLKSARPLPDQIISPTFMWLVEKMSLSSCFNDCLKLQELESPCFLLLSLRSQKWIRDTGGFTGVNPPMPKLAQGVYEKTVQFRFCNCL